jgi:hypothetical protein
MRSWLGEKLSREATLLFTFTKIYFALGWVNLRFDKLIVNLNTLFRVLRLKELKFV